MAKNPEEIREKEQPAVQKYGKQALLKSRRFAKHRDLLGAILGEHELLSTEETDKKIKEFLERQVN